MPDIFTVTEERPDLADVNLNLPENLIALKVIPTVPVTIVSSKFRYYVPVADVAAQQDRSVGVAPTKTRVANTEGTFTCAEIIKRAAVSPDEAKNFGGIEVADEAGSRYAKKQVALALEEKAAAAFLDVAALDAFDPVNLLKQVNTANAQLKSYYGKLSLVASEQVLTNMFNALVQEARVGTMFVRIVSGTAPGVAIEGLTQAQRFAALAAYMGVKQVFAGLDDVWGSTAARAPGSVVRPRISSSAPSIADRTRAAALPVGAARPIKTRSAVGITRKRCIRALLSCRRPFIFQLPTTHFCSHMPISCCIFKLHSWFIL